MSGKTVDYEKVRIALEVAKERNNRDAVIAFESVLAGSTLAEASRTLGYSKSWGGNIVKAYTDESSDYTGKRRGPYKQTKVSPDEVSFGGMAFIPKTRVEQLVKELEKQKMELAESTLGYFVTVKRIAQQKIGNGHKVIELVVTAHDEMFEALEPGEKIMIREAA